MQYFDKVVYTFSADNEPTGTIDSGEIVIFRTQDCFSNQMHSESQLVTSCDYSKMNPATGPLFVRDAQPGDVIKVELLDVQCDTIGTTTTLPKIGPLWDKCETRTKRIPIENGKAVFNDVTFPINPMIGVIGVAPEKGKSVPCGYPGSHGGNLDCKLMVKGNTAYFPVRVEGGLVQMGDMHAVMGDSVKARAKIYPQSARKTRRSKYPVSCNTITQKGGLPRLFFSCLAHRYIHYIWLHLPQPLPADCVVGRSQFHADKGPACFEAGHAGAPCPHKRIQHSAAGRRHLQQLS